jgi:hypothetical protein
MASPTVHTPLTLPFPPVWTAEHVLPMSPVYTSPKGGEREKLVNSMK